MALKSQHYPMSEPVVKPEGGRANEPECSTERESQRGSERQLGRDSERELERGSERQLERDDRAPANERGGDAGSDAARPSAARPSAARPGDGASPPLVLRLLNYNDIGEVRAFVTLLYEISAEADPFHFDKSPAFIDACVVKARREEKPDNTFAGLALEGKQMVGVHVLRRFEEGPLVGAHIAGLWVAKRCRSRGVARKLKAMGEAWARSIGAHFLNSNVLVQNEPMLALNRKLGFEGYRVNLRKRL
jgi:ribosomal protein S18 acetylase RimI-like enzyme